ncbi:MAG TPA: tRNA (adenosine(37)-N6)-threonylcarbamoyltransferase complex dimerization subunit type 1 TsaB [Patescibacteria group bacterium]|nr:tRNA (adenosine(37)-N6)-threonylcarbamoyltransferase complex dimerization subunit type 1 TsaB [Patescibacteria group bacterium]
MNNILFIDTSNNKEVKVGFEINGEKFFIEQLIDHRKAQAVLPLVEKLLEEHDLKLKDITAITVNPGPGSFTGVRVGVAIANTLGFLLHIPVNGLPVGEQVEAVY